MEKTQIIHYQETTFAQLSDADRQLMQAAIDATGYTCLGIESSPYEKKGLFGWK